MKQMFSLHMSNQQWVHENNMTNGIPNIVTKYQQNINKLSTNYQLSINRLSTVYQQIINSLSTV